MDKVAIVILNWNGQAMLEMYMPSVLQYSKDEATVYVADNASTDQSMEMLRQHFPEVKLIQLEKNWGFAEGYNKALKQVDAEYYLLLNSDIEVTRPVSQSCFQSLIRIVLNMLERVGDTSTTLAIPSVVDVFSKQLRKMMVSMIMPLTFSGLQVLH